jgi:hypothetical protein
MCFFGRSFEKKTKWENHVLWNFDLFTWYLHFKGRNEIKCQKYLFFRKREFRFSKQCQICHQQIEKSDLLHGQPLFYALEKKFLFLKTLVCYWLYALAFIYYYFPISGTYSKGKKFWKENFLLDLILLKYKLCNKKLIQIRREKIVESRSSLSDLICSFKEGWTYWVEASLNFLPRSIDRSIKLQVLNLIF